MDFSTATDLIGNKMWRSVMAAAVTTLSTKAMTRWVVALTGIGSLMAALDTLAVSTAQNSVVASVADDLIGKAAGANGMMPELGGVFGVALAVAVFAGMGGYASTQAFIDGFAPATGVGAGLAALGALSGLALPGRRRTETTLAMVAVDQAA
jgi:hypothetical protein